MLAEIPPDGYDDHAILIACIVAVVTGALIGLFGF